MAHNRRARRKYGNGTGISDIFFGKGGKTQIDGFQCNVFQISANSVGTSAGTKTIVSNIEIVDTYIRGVVPGCSVVTKSVVSAEGGGVATIDSHPSDR
jgi:hypothetical protein